MSIDSSDNKTTKKPKTENRTLKVLLITKVLVTYRALAKTGNKSSFKTINRNTEPNSLVLTPLAPAQLAVTTTVNKQTWN